MKSLKSYLLLAVLLIPFVSCAMDEEKNFLGLSAPSNKLLAVAALGVGAAGGAAYWWHTSQQVVSTDRKLKKAPIRLTSQPNEQRRFNQAQTQLCRTHDKLVLDAMHKIALLRGALTPDEQHYGRIVWKAFTERPKALFERTSFSDWYLQMIATTDSISPELQKALSFVPQWQAQVAQAVQEGSNEYEQKTGLDGDCLIDTISQYGNFDVFETDYVALDITLCPTDEQVRNFMRIRKDTDANS